MQKHLQDLINDIKNKKQTVLFLGAGVNYDYNPQRRLLWNDVLSEFVKNAIPLLNMPADDINELKVSLNPSANNNSGKDSNSDLFSAESKVSVIKKLLGNDYVPLLRQIIYSRCNRAILKKACDEYVKEENNPRKTPFDTLFVLAEMILKYDNIKAVVSYNYDNFLTQAIKLLQQHPDYFKDRTKNPRLNIKNFRPIDVYSGWTDEPYVNSSFLIYHPHGYIQPPAELIPNERNQVVMSMEEFYENAKEVYSWQNATQIHFLTHYMCVYIGASLTDMNMQRLLSTADIKHNNESIYYLTIKGDAQSRLKEIFHTENHLKVVSCDNYQNLYSELLNINTINNE